MNMKKKTYSGRIIDYANPQSDQISIIDIARGLSSEYKYNGHTYKKITLAQHSILVSMVMCGYEKEGLLNNAYCAYIKDIPEELKSLLVSYREIELRFIKAIKKAFNLKECNQIMKEAEKAVLITEFRDVFCSPFESQKIYNELIAESDCIPLDNKIVLLNEEESHKMFLKTYSRYFNE